LVGTEDAIKRSGCSFLNAAVLYTGNSDPNVFIGTGAEVPLIVVDRGNVDVVSAGLAELIELSVSV
jgi:hypothetical protein